MWCYTFNIKPTLRLLLGTTFRCYLEVHFYFSFY